jgi:hypothetical protein
MKAIQFLQTDHYTLYVVHKYFHHAALYIEHEGHHYSMGFAGSSNNLELISPDPHLFNQFIYYQSDPPLGDEKADRLNKLMRDFEYGSYYGRYVTTYYASYNNSSHKYGYLSNNCISLLNQIFPELNDHFSCTFRTATKVMYPTIRAGKRTKRRKKALAKLI